MIMIVDELIRVCNFVDKKKPHTNMQQRCIEIISKGALFEHKLKRCLFFLALLPVLSANKCCDYIHAVLVYDISVPKYLQIMKQLHYYIVRLRVKRRSVGNPILQRALISTV